MSDPLKTIMEGLKNDAEGSKAPVQPSQLDEEAMRRYFENSNQSILFPPYSKMRNAKTKENADENKGDKEPTN